MTGIPRVLLLTPDYPPDRGGIQYLLHGIVRHATRLDFRVVTLGSQGGPGQPHADVRRVTARGPRGGVIAMLNAVAVAEGRNWHPDVVLSGHIVMAPAARLTGVPFVQYLYADEIAHQPVLTSMAVRAAKATIVLGTYGRSLAVAAGSKPSRLHSIPPGIDLPPRAMTTPLERGPRIVTVARLDERYKGFDVLVRALPLILSRVPDATLMLVGGGHLRASLTALAVANGCADAVQCTGGVSNATRDELLSAASVFAMPSRLPVGSGGEGFGIVYLEAGAHGTPVVAADVGGSVDAVLDGVTGLLVDPEDHIAVAEAIASLLIDRRRAAQLGEAGREWAEAHAWPNVVRKVEDLLIGAATGTL